MVKSRGLQKAYTLVEVLVTLTVFGLVLTLTLWAYVQGVKANQRHDESSDAFRRANLVFQRVSTLIESSEILHVDDRHIIFHPHGKDAISKKRSYNWRPHAHTLVSTEGALEVHLQEKKAEVLKLKRWEKVSFSSQQVQSSDPDQRKDVLQVTLESHPPSVTKEDRDYDVSRTIILERY